MNSGSPLPSILRHNSTIAGKIITIYVENPSSTKGKNHSLVRMSKSNILRKKMDCMGTL